MVLDHVQRDGFNDALEFRHRVGIGRAADEVLQLELVVGVVKSGRVEGAWLLRPRTTAVARDGRSRLPALEGMEQRFGGCVDSALDENLAECSQGWHAADRDSHKDLRLASKV